MIYLTRKCEFSASHYYHNPQWSEEQNLRAFGKCANLNGHGHNYTLEVTVKGEIDPVTGFVVDLKELKDILNNEVVEPMDHRFLNREVPPFDKVVPTAENIATEIWRRLFPKIQRNGVKLRNVRLYETADLFVDYGESA